MIPSHRPSSPLILLAALAGFGIHPSASAQMTYTPGDIILGFQATGGDGSSNAYVYNLGQGPGFRDGTSTGLIGSIGADLASTYGATWFERPDVYWGIAGVRDPSASGANTVVDGDAKATIYISRIAPNGPGDSTPWVLATGPTVISAATSVATMQFGFRSVNGNDIVTPETQRTPTPSSNGRGTVQGTGDINNWSVFNPVGGPAFGNVLTGGVQAPFGEGVPVRWLDLYRLVGRSNEAATPNSPLGQGLFVGSFSINAAGEVRFQPAATPSDPYASWADSFGLTGNDRNFDADPDADGLENGIEFVVGGHPDQTGDADKAPTLSRDDEAIIFVYRRVDAAADSAPAVQFSTNQFATWSPATHGVGGVVVTTDNDGFGAGVDRVTVRIPWTPAVSPSIFARLIVNQAP